MIVADSSAILAILLKEPDADTYFEKLLAAEAVSISAVNWWEVEVRMLSSFGPVSAAETARWMNAMRISAEAVTSQHAAIAFEAFARFGCRPARLNMGDCFAYALSREKDAPLLYKGGDFGHTDVKAA